ncbi:hypothetical protein AGR13a_Cc250037 [Agrobacterium genomosp. 13 str. CFBP 6927]|uniref:Transmembrane protein n=1 Tax=Agrobacterium genomosp. 13 str. CFBP 6927 TaxID=1183428 RepID=A0ABM9VES9_9HYPH|nr:hypothetical protein AGR13a_Cc250037 [Agrobacterium genomosp. 13 str. CFBP 6927]
MDPRVKPEDDGAFRREVEARNPVSGHISTRSGVCPFSYFTVRAQTARQIQLSRSPKGVSASKFLVPILLLSPDRLGLSALSPEEDDLPALFSRVSRSAWSDAIVLFSSSWAFASVVWASSDCFAAICDFSSETVEDEVEDERTEAAMFVPETAETMGRLVAEV